MLVDGHAIEVIALPGSIVSRRHPFAVREGWAVAQTFPLASPATHRSALLSFVGVLPVVVVPVVVVPVVAPVGAQATDSSAPPLFGFSSRADLFHFIEYAVAALAIAGSDTQAASTASSGSALLGRISFELIDSKKCVVLAAKMADSAAKRAERRAPPASCWD
jgi:hypothetical protein